MVSDVGLAFGPAVEHGLAGVLVGRAIDYL